MKIIFIGGRDIHSLGGIESYMYNLTRSLHDEGHDIIIYCESNVNKVIYENGIKVVYLKGFKSNLICKPWVSLKATIMTLVKEGNVSLIHYNAWPPSLWSFIPRLFGIKTLLQEHGFEWRHTKYSKMQVIILKIMEQLTAYTNTNIVCVSQEQSEYFKVHYRRKSTVIPCAVNLPDYTQPESGILHKYNLGKKKFFLFLGRLSKEKNIEQLIKAFDKIGDYKLVIAGTNTVETYYVEELKNLAANNQNIVFTGAVYGADKHTLLLNAYAFCLTSSVEGLSIALLEAMSYKIPIIASDIVANKDILGNDAVYVTAESDEDMHKAYNAIINAQYDINHFVSENYLKVVHNYTWSKVAKQYSDFIKSIV